MREEEVRLNLLTGKFMNELKSNIPDVIFQEPENRVPGFISLCIPGRSGSEMVAGLSLSGFSVSTGSACHANEVAPSRVLLAIGRSKREAIGALRITMGRGTTESSVGELAQVVVDIAGI
jgi:cysteine desulfurase